LENVVFMLSLDKRKQLDWKKIQSEHEGGDSGWGGAGTRLYPITAYVPKALITVESRYLIEYIINYLKHHEIHDVVMLVSDAFCSYGRPR
jgi:hypothetical protein